MIRKIAKRINRAEGFTLIELLIVVAIIALLAAIAIPQFSMYRKRGYAAQLNSDVKNAYTAAQSFFIDNPNGTLSADCAELAASGFQKSATSTCAVVGGAPGTFTSITMTGVAGWGLSNNVASVTIGGALTPAAI